MSTVAAPASAREALDMIQAALGFLAATERDPDTQALVLRELELDEAGAAGSGRAGGRDVPAVSAGPAG